jgi:hypothetical protein
VTVGYVGFVVWDKLANLQERIVCCLFVWGVNKASQEEALQRHPGIELSFNIPMYGGYDLGCHRRFPFYPRRDFE